MEVKVYTDKFLETYRIIPTTTISDIKRKYFQYNIRFFLDKRNEMDVFNTDSYDSVTLENVWEKLTDPRIYLKNKSLIKNINKNMPKIRIGQQMKGRAYPVVKGFTQIPCWSRGAGDWKLLSPFYLKFNYNGKATLFENFWQSFKVWEKVDRQNTKSWKWPAEYHITNDSTNDSPNDVPNKNWQKWHSALMYHNEPVRRPNGKAVPKYAYYEDKRLNVIEARKEIYIPFLKQLYRESPVYQKLLARFRFGENLLLIEPDGPFLDVYPEGLEVDSSLLEKLISVTNYADEGYPQKYRPYGHAYVLSTCLLEDY